MSSRGVPALQGEGGLSRYLTEIRKFPLLQPEEEYMLAKRWREHEDPEARQAPDHQPFAARGQDRDGLSRLRPAGVRDRRRRQCRADAGGQALRARPRLPAGNLCDVVDPGRDSGIHPALLEPRQNGHDRGAEKALLQSEKGQKPHQRARRRRFDAGASGGNRRPAGRERKGGRRHEPANSPGPTARSTRR